MINLFKQALEFRRAFNQPILHNFTRYGFIRQKLYHMQVGLIEEESNICKKCSMIYDPVAGDPDSGIAPGTPFEAIPDDWSCPICGVTKASFVPYRTAQLKAA